MADKKKPEYDLRTLNVTDLKPNEWNPQDQDEATFNRLREEIRRVGFISPVEVVPLDDGKFQILGGEHRWKAAMAEGLETIPAIVLSDAKWKDSDLQKFVTVRLNMLRGKLDPEKFAKLYNEMADRYGADSLQDLMGVTDAKGFQKMLSSVSKGLGGVSKEIKKKFDESAKEAKTVEELTSILQELFTKYGETMSLSFMVFAHGKKEHIYVAMDHNTQRSMQKVVEYCKMAKEDINSVMAPVIESCVKECELKLSSVYSDAPKGTDKN